MAEENDSKDVVDEKNDYATGKGKKSIFSRFWNGLLRLYDDDFEKRLRYISREEATILARMKKRSTRWRKTARNLIVSSVLLEVVAIGYAIMTTQSVKLEWQMRALRVLPVFVLPVLAWVLYSGIRSLTGMCDRRDQRTLERLRAERQEKIDELKDRTNYYNTQQLIQKYDPDPAAKAAAASVLASKLGADSGLQLFVDESHLNQPDTAKSSDVDFMQSGGLRRRAPSEARSPGSNAAQQFDKEGFHYAGSEVSEISLHSELVVDHQSHVAPNPQDGGWMARLAALLVGEDPTQSYALICGNCHMHNGLARKEDFLVFTYYCPHCHALNKPRNMDGSSSCTNSPNMRSLMSHLNKGQNPSGTNSPDLKSSPTTRHHHMNIPKKSGADINKPDMKPRTANRDQKKKPEKTVEENTVVNGTMVKESSESDLCVRSSTPFGLGVDEKKEMAAAEDGDNQ